VHPYDVPAIVAMPLSHVSDAYAAWALENTDT
jgi:periplasmic divalent cation tolerance protein